MVGISQRMRKLQTRLLQIRLGSGAVVLPKEIKRIHLEFAQGTTGGHKGPKDFWRNELIRLKYHNPAIPMTVERSKSTRSPATMSIHFAPTDAEQTSTSATSSAAPTGSTSAATTTSEHTPTARVETLNMKDYTNGEIMDALIRLTKAYPIEPTEDDRELMAKLEEQRQRSARDSKLTLEVNARLRREKELLEQARGDVGTQA